MQDGTADRHPDRRSSYERVLWPGLWVGLPVSCIEFYLQSAQQLGLRWPDKVFGSAAALWMGVSACGAAWHLHGLDKAPAGRYERAVDKTLAAVGRVEQAISPYVLWVGLPAMGLWVFFVVRWVLAGLPFLSIPLLVWRALYFWLPLSIRSKWLHWERKTGWASPTPREVRPGTLRMLLWTTLGVGLIALQSLVLPFLVLCYRNR